MQSVGFHTQSVGRCGQGIYFRVLGGGLGRLQLHTTTHGRAQAFTQVWLLEHAVSLRRLLSCTDNAMGGLVRTRPGNLEDTDTFVRCPSRLPAVPPHPSTPPALPTRPPHPPSPSALSIRTLHLPSAPDLLPQPSTPTLHTWPLHPPSTPARRCQTSRR